MVPMIDAKEIESVGEVWVLLILSRGADTRRRILKTLIRTPKNCNQMARELGSSWWTVQKHLQRLIKAGLIVSMNFGHTKFYKITQKGELALKFASSKS